MSYAVTIRCDGQQRSCPAQIEREGRDAELVVEAARAAGWHFPNGPYRLTLCPDCAPDRKKGCARCIGYGEFSEVLGHDTIGHRCSNKLVAAGVSTWERLMDASEWELNSIKGLGDAAMDRIRQARAQRRQEQRKDHSS